MIARQDYAGPITKSAEAMFARIERSAHRAALRTADDQPRVARPMSLIRQVVHGLGLTMTVLRHWEDAGVIAFARVRGRRVVDEAALECLRTVVELRRAGFSVKEIARISDTLPPTAQAMRAALQARQDTNQAARRTRSSGPAPRAAPQPDGAFLSGQHP